VIVILDNGQEYSSHCIAFVRLPSERLDELRSLLPRYADIQYAKRGWYVMAETESLTWRSDDETADGDAFIADLRHAIEDHEWRIATLAASKHEIDQAVAAGVPRWRAEHDVIFPTWHRRCEERARSAAGSSAGSASSAT